MAEVTVKTIPDQLALTVTKRLNLADMGQGMREAFAALMAHVEAGGAQFAGPPFCYYPGEMGDEYDVVVCMPVVPGATEGESIGLETVPGGTVASVMHRGPYSTIGETYGALQGWMAANGKAPAGPPREVYLNDPATVPAADLLTEIDWPVT